MMMNDKEILIKNIENIHTTPLGIERIRNNLNLDTYNVIEYCVDAINDDNSVVTKKGKNYYVRLRNTEITINSSSFTIITAHIKKEKNMN